MGSKNLKILIFPEFMNILLNEKKIERTDQEKKERQS